MLLSPISAIFGGGLSVTIAVIHSIIADVTTERYDDADHMYYPLPPRLTAEQVIRLYIAVPRGCCGSYCWASHRCEDDAGLATMGPFDHLRPRSYTHHLHLYNLSPRDSPPPHGRTSIITS